MKVRVDLDRRIGCGTREGLCPGVVEAAESCPQDAIVTGDG